MKCIYTSNSRIFLQKCYSVPLNRLIFLSKQNSWEIKYPPKLKVTVAKVCPSFGFFYSNLPAFHSRPPSLILLQYSPECQEMPVFAPPRSSCGWRCPRGWRWWGWWCWRSPSATELPDEARCPGRRHWWWCGHMRGGDRRRSPPKFYKIVFSFNSLREGQNMTPRTACILCTLDKLNVF